MGVCVGLASIGRVQSQILGSSLHIPLVWLCSSLLFFVFYGTGGLRTNGLVSRLCDFSHLNQYVNRPSWKVRLRLKVHGAAEIPVIRRIVVPGDAAVTLASLL
jgi:hypothetical protein